MGGMLGAYDLLQRNADVRASWGYEPKYLESFDYYTSINPALRPSFRRKVGEIASVYSEITPDEFQSSRIYQEWAKPQGIVDALQTTLEKTPLAMAVLAFSRSEKQGVVDRALCERLLLLAPHFRRAVLIGKVIDLARIEAAAFSDTIDGLAAAVFLVDESGHLLHANTGGDAMLAAGDLLRVADGALAVANAKAQRVLAASFAAAREGDLAIEAHGIAVPMTGADGERYAAHVLPMTSGRRRAAQATQGAVAALFVREVDMEFPAVVRALGEIYRLTAAEVRTLHVILDVGRVATASLLLRLSEATVKTHLRHIFQKTGARNQVDLVKLAAGLSSPLAR
jgi:DNA-binding CsgD family transcriptional regulator